MLPSSSTTGGAADIAVVKGNTQTGAPGTMLPDSIVVKVTDSAGVPLAGEQVQFSPVAPGAVVSPETSTTDARGLAGARWVLGPAAGPQEVVAHVVGGSDQLQVRFTASARPPVTGNQPPTAVSDEYSTLEGYDHTLQVSAASGVLPNDRDPEGGPLAASDASDPPSGRVTLNRDGSFSYTPDPDFFGDDRFSYTASDEAGNSSSATVTIHVAPVNDPPGFNDRGDPRRVKAGAGPQTVRDWATSVHPGADNERDQALEFVVTGNSNPGLFTSGGQPAVTITDRQAGKATLTYTPSGQGGSATITVVLKDNGGTANGGLDTSPPHTFTIRVRS